MDEKGQGLLLYVIAFAVAAVLVVLLFSIGCWMFSPVAESIPFC